MPHSLLAVCLPAPSTDKHCARCSKTAGKCEYCSDGYKKVRGRCVVDSNAAA